jgi:hypothetical protein
MPPLGSAADTANHRDAEPAYLLATAESNNKIPGRIMIEPLKQENILRQSEEYRPTLWGREPRRTAGQRPIRQAPPSRLMGHDTISNCGIEVVVARYYESRWGVLNELNDNRDYPSSPPR